MPIPLRRLAAAGFLFVLGTGCARNPVAPDAVYGPAATPAKEIASSIDSHTLPQSVASSIDDRLQIPFQLTGRFTFTTESGDSLTGIYVGEASVATSGRDEAVLQMTVTGGTGIFTGASGELTGKAKGSFTGEGDFILIVSGSIATNAEPSAFRFHVPLTGSAAASCGADQRIVMILNGNGSGGTAGKVTAALSHQVSNTTCFED